MSLTSKHKEEIKARIRKAAERNSKSAVKAHVDDQKGRLEEVSGKMFSDDLVVGEHQQLFSELFFDPVKELNLPDFAVDTFHHVDFPSWVKEMLPEKDPSYVWNKRAVYDFLVSDDMHAFLVGLPGSGKTSLPYQVGAVTGRPVFKISFSQDLERDEWVESKEISDKGTEWRRLPFVDTLDYPFYVVLDEFNRLRRGGRLLLNRLLDFGGTMQLNDGSSVKPNNQWRAVATDNTRGLGDGLDKFDGDIADISTLDRFGVMVEVDYLSHNEQVGLIQSWESKIPHGVASAIVALGCRVVAAYKNNDLDLPWTPRRMREVCRLTMRYKNPVAAIRSVYYEFLPDDSQKKLVDQYINESELGIFGEI